MSPFEFFKLKPQVFMDKDALDKAYQRIQALIHPDQHSDELAKQAALALSAKAANSYSKLKDPMGCVEVMLFELGGVTLDQLSTESSQMMTFVFELQEQILDGADKALILKETEIKLKDIGEKIEAAFHDKESELLKLYSLKFAYLYRFWIGH